MSIQLLALSGFMGLPTDWDLFGFKNLKAFNSGSLEWNSLSDWSEKFNSKLRSQRKSILMGYSLGGRLALHALTQDPSNWHAGIIISAHPGLSNHEQRLDRCKVDEYWANRFEIEEWKSLMDDWNARTVFAGGNFHFQREEKDYHRQSLANTLRYRSLGLQSDLRNKVSRLNIPILWIAGDKDETYKSLALSMDLKHSLSRKIIIPDSGHRVPWDQPDAFVEHVQDFLIKLKFR